MGKERLGFKQYISNKRLQFGIKMFSLCEVRSGYLWNSFVYLEKNYNPTEDEINYKRELGKSGGYCTEVNVIIV